MPNKKMCVFFEKKEVDGVALTFDDVLLRGGRANFAPWDIVLESKISRNVGLRTPIVGAAMSSVMGPQMAIALAKIGGIGSIPRSYDPETQASIVGGIKHHIHGFIDTPKTADVEETIAKLLQRRAERGWKFDSFPVLDKGRKLLGIVTHNDFKRCDDESLLVGAIMTPLEKLITAQKGISERDAYNLLRVSDKNVLPVLRTDGTLAGIYTFSDLKRIIVERPTTHNVDGTGRLRVAAAIGAGDEAYLRAELLIAKGVDVLHIDMANGWQDFVINTTKELKRKYRNGPDIVIGNFAVGDAVREALEETDADGILVGIGGGSICTTRKIVGTGVPQVTAVYHCAYEAEKFGVPVCSDGGIRMSGDIAIALAAGAHSVMVGGLIAGTDEAPGKKWQLKDGSCVKDYYGMGSERAMRESPGSRQRYLQGQGVLIPEGIEGTVPYKGPVADVLAVQLGGVRKALHSNGARTIEELHEKARFIEVTAAGQRESHPHDITITAQTPNYFG